MASLHDIIDCQLIEYSLQTVSDVKPEDTASKGEDAVDGAGKDSGSGLEQNTLV